MARCAGTKPDSTPCERIVKASETYCYAHDPAYASRRRSWASKGGKTGGKGRSSKRKEVAEVRKLTRRLIAGRATDTLNTGAAMHLPQILDLLRTYVKLCELELRLMDTEERREPERQPFPTDALAAFLGAPPDGTDPDPR